MTRITSANETDIPMLVSLNNRFSASGLTLARTPEFAANHLSDYRVLRDASGGVVGCIALDEYSPSVAEVMRSVSSRAPSIPRPSCSSGPPSPRAISPRAPRWT